MQHINIDTEEIKKFSQPSSIWWDDAGEFKPLHAINPLRLQFIESHLPLNQKKILDVGCGGGILAESMAKKGAIVTGIDMSCEALKQARQHAEQAKLNIHYSLCTVEEMAAKESGTFDLVTCMEMLEHIPDPAAAIKACAQLTKHNGFIFISTLNRTLKAYLLAVIGAEYLLKLLPKGTHDYAKFIRPSELAQWSRTFGLNLENIIGIVYNPITQVYSLSQDIHVNYIMCLRKS